MNVFDKFIEIISPNAAIKREDARLKLSFVKSMRVSNSGYSELSGFGWAKLYYRYKNIDQGKLKRNKTGYKRVGKSSG